MTNYIFYEYQYQFNRLIYINIYLYIMVTQHLILETLITSFNNLIKHIQMS